MSPVSLTITKDNGSIGITWIGGDPPYVLESTNDLNSAWAKIGWPTMATFALVPYSGGTQFFRVQQDLPLLDAVLTNTQTILIWLVPELA